MKKLVICTLFISAMLFQVDTFPQNFWQQTNGPYGGSVRSLVVNSAGYNFLGSKGGGVLRSTNNGDKWVPMNNGLIPTDIFALAINSDGEIFAGCTERRYV